MFNHGKLIHCFLNQHLLSIPGEANFHANCLMDRVFVERVVIPSNYNLKHSEIEKSARDILEKNREYWENKLQEFISKHK